MRVDRKDPRRLVTRIDVRSLRPRPRGKDRPGTGLLNHCGDARDSVVRRLNNTTRVGQRPTVEPCRQRLARERVELRPRTPLAVRCKVRPR